MQLSGAMTPPAPAGTPATADIGRAVWLLDAAERACVVLAAAGVRVCVVKGASLVGWIYAPGERSMQDVDLLVAPRDRERAAHALRSAGYQRVARPHSPTGMWLHPTLDWTSPSGVLVDLHTTIGALLRFPVPSEDILRRAVAHPTLGPHALRPCPVDAVLLHALDVAKDDGARKASADEDLLRMVAAGAAGLTADRLDWDEVVARARRFGCAGTLWWRLCMLQQGSDLRASAIPAATVATLRPHPPRRALLRAVQQGGPRADGAGPAGPAGAAAARRALCGLAHSDFAGRYLAAAALFSARSLVDRGLVAADRVAGKAR